ncbi:MucBP domain-containing protein [Vagococcus lutrae]|uniref:lectin-like domain-containing protein n=1 Tax=Vagococcus lutrae TaxID=81947 RepID=UPI001C938FA0|nr:MucBP domain-containing protein [Vagococcus lutrae]QZN88330.1 MucBP domain-containing protein [Vagococcus lutrae]
MNTQNQTQEIISEEGSKVTEAMTDTPSELVESQTSESPNMLSPPTTSFVQNELIRALKFNFKGDAKYAQLNNVNSDIIMTPNQKHKKGSIWSTIPVSVYGDITISAELKFGSTAIPADGMTFAIQNQVPSFLGRDGEALGLYDQFTQGRLLNGVAIEMDTYLDNGAKSPGATGVYENTNDELIASGDRSGGHIAWVDASGFNYKNNGGHVVHHDTYHFPATNRIANNQWHKFKATWRGKTKKLEYEFDGIKGTADGSSIQGEIMYWGFTAATGEFSSEQRIRNITQYIPTPEPEKPAEGTIQVEYRDENTKASIRTTDNYSGTIGTSKTISPPAIVGYSFSTSDPTNRTVMYSNPAKKVILYYKKNTVPPENKQGIIQVEYRDENTKASIRKTDNYSGTIGTSKTISPPAIAGYSFSTSDPTNRTVMYSNPAKKVILYYKKNTVPPTEQKGKVLLRYRSVLNVNIVLLPDKYVEGEVGMSEKFTPLPISGYEHYDTTPANGIGTYKTTDYEVITFRYLPSQPTPEQKKGEVRLEYRDYDNQSQLISKSQIYTGNVGTTQTFAPIPVEGYEFYFSNPSPASVTYSDSQQTIVFYYKKNPPLVQKGWVKIKYRDWDDKTKVLAPDKIEEGIVGMQQRFYPIEIPDYTYYGSNPTNSEAVFKNGSLDEVVFYYTKNKPTVKLGKISVEYRDKKTDEVIYHTDYFEGNVGTSIEINPVYLSSYLYLESQPILPDDHKVIFAEEETKIVFYYQKIGNPVEKKGKITIKHIDIENPTKILEEETIEWPINKIYKGQEKNFPDYKFIKAEPQNKQIELKNENEEKELLFYYQMKKLIFVSAPHLDFGNHPLSKGHQNYELESLDQPLAVQDFRKNGSKWRVELTVTQDFTSRNGRYKLPNAFYYKDNRIDYSLPEKVSLPIFEHETTSNQIVNISDTWQANRVGPHLQISGEQNVLPVAYEAQLTWSLSSVP